MDRQIDRWNIYKCIELNYCKTFTERFKRQWEVGKFCGRFSWGAQGEFPPGCMRLAAFFLPGFLERMTLFPLHSLLRSAQCPWPSPLPPSTHPSLFWISWFKLIIASTEHPKPKWSFGARAGIKPGEWQGNQSRTQDRHTFPGKPSRTGIHPCLVAPAPTCTKALLPLFLVILRVVYCPWLLSAKVWQVVWNTCLQWAQGKGLVTAWDGGGQWETICSLTAPTEARAIWFNLIKSQQYRRRTVPVPINYPPVLQLACESGALSYVTRNAARENYSSSALSAHSFALSPASGDVCQICVVQPAGCWGFVFLGEGSPSASSYIKERTLWQWRKQAELLQESTQHECCSKGFTLHCLNPF